MFESIAIKEDSDSLSLQNLYPYFILPEDGSAVIPPSVDFSNWLIPSDFNGYFPYSTYEKKTLSIKEIYPGKEGPLIHRGIQTEIWFTPLLFLAFLSYGLIFSRKREVLLQDLKEFFTFSFINKTCREESFIDNFQSRFFLIISGIVNASLFYFLAVAKLLDHQMGNFTSVLFFLFLIIMLYALFKIATIGLICYVFFNKGCFSVLTKTLYSIIIFFGIVLIPVILCLSFGPASWIVPAVYIGLFFCICLSILYLFKILIFFFEGVSSLFYLILYLCSLEILPAFIFVNGLIDIVTKNG